MKIFNHNESIVIKGLKFNQRYHQRMAYALSQHKPVSDKVDLVIAHIHFVISVNGQLDTPTLKLKLSPAQVAAGKAGLSAKRSLFKFFSQQGEKFAESLQQHASTTDSPIICHGIILEMHALKTLSPQASAFFEKLITRKVKVIRQDNTHEDIYCTQTEADAAEEKLKAELMKHGIQIAHNDTQQPFVFLRFSCAEQAQPYAIDPKICTADAVKDLFGFDNERLANLLEEYTIITSDPDAPRQITPSVKKTAKPSARQPYPGPHPRRIAHVAAGKLPQTETEFTAAGATFAENYSPDLTATPAKSARKRSSPPHATQESKHVRVNDEIIQVQEASQVCGYSSQSQSLISPRSTESDLFRTPIQSEADSDTPTTAALSRTSSTGGVFFQRPRSASLSLRSDSDNETLQSNSDSEFDASDNEGANKTSPRYI